MAAFKQLPTDMAAQHALLSSVDRQLPAEAQQACEGAEGGLTLEELHSALKPSARNKKPGSDGLPYEFFSHFWDLLGPELLEALLDCFQDQHAPSSCSQQESPRWLTCMLRCSFSTHNLSQTASSQCCWHCRQHGRPLPSQHHLLTNLRYAGTAA